MTRIGYTPYEPQLALVERAENVWTVEGPEIDYRLAGMVLPCPTRMTVVRLSDGSLWVHSPVVYSAELDRALALLGPVAFLIVPNSYHYSHVGAWAGAHPAACVIAYTDRREIPGVAQWAAIEAETSPLWGENIACMPINLGSFKEAVFFHHASRTLIVTDLMQNFEVSRVNGFWTRLLLQAGGATGPNGRPSIEIRLAARKHRAALRAGVQQMIAWKPAKIILSHGKCFETNAVDEIERAFAKILC